MKKESNEYGSGKLFDMEDDLKNLCRVIRNYVPEHKWEECDRLIPKYMELYPDSAVPHNLRGIVMEKQGRHAEAMKHFRAAQALDASYVPANFNMERFASFEKEGRVEPAFDVNDCIRMKGEVKGKKNYFFLRNLGYDAELENPWS